MKYLKVSLITQCTNCQKFGYIGDRCSTRAYRFYMAIHLSKDHTCPTYIITGKLCKHITPLYINCKEKQFVNSKECKSLKTAKLIHQ